MSGNSARIQLNTTVDAIKRQRKTKKNMTTLGNVIETATVKAQICGVVGYVMVWLTIFHIAS